MNIYKKLLNIQTELKAPKGQKNTFGNYKYRSCEDILEAVKPLLKENNVTLQLTDKIEFLGDRYYIKATAILIDTEDTKGGEIACIENTAYARESETKKGMDDSQITGTASSYARKYALNGLFCIDDTKDADTNEYKTQENNDKLIDKKMIESLNKAIENAKIQDDVVYLILNQYGYSNTAEIKIKDYMNIVNDFKSKKQE